MMGVLVVLLRDVLFQQIELAPTVEHAIVVTICIAAGAVAYLALARLLKVEESGTLWRLLVRR